MDDLTARIGYRFENSDLARTALTHRSAAARRADTYERLEFLGDRVLALVIADLLYETYPDEEEGALAKRLVDLVRRETLAEVASSIDLGSLIRLSRGEEEAGGRENPAILADVCEALIGAVYRDGGIDPARTFIHDNWTARMSAAVKPPKDAKTILQEWAQGQGMALPDYTELSRSGPDHAPIFEIQVTVGDFPPERGGGATKRAAEQIAAERLLLRLGVTDG